MEKLEFGRILNLIKISKTNLCQGFELKVTYALNYLIGTFLVALLYPTLLSLKAYYNIHVLRHA